MASYALQVTLEEEGGWRPDGWTVAATPLPECELGEFAVILAEAIAAAAAMRPTRSTGIPPIRRRGPVALRAVSPLEPHTSPSRR